MSHAAPYNPRGGYDAAVGPKFASLPGLALVVTIIDETPADVSLVSDSVSLVLPDGTRVRRLDPAAMEAWLHEVHGATFPGQEQELPWLKTAEQKEEYEADLQRTIPAGGGHCWLLVFRAPRGTPSGTVTLDYTLRLASGKELPHSKAFRMNIKK